MRSQGYIWSRIIHDLCSIVYIAGLIHAIWPGYLREKIRRIWSSSLTLLLVVNRYESLSNEIVLNLALLPTVINITYQIRLSLRRKFQVIERTPRCNTCLWRFRLIWIPMTLSHESSANDCRGCVLTSCRTFYPVINRSNHAFELFHSLLLICSYYEHPTCQRLSRSDRRLGRLGVAFDILLLKMRSQGADNEVA